MQTNAILVDEDWISFFAKHRISVGVSLDGPKHINDVNRVDHKKRGTYDAVVKGIRVLQRAAAHDLIPGPGVICVIDPTQDAAEIYRHFVDELELHNMSFLLPMGSHDQSDPAIAAKMKIYLADLIAEWRGDDNPNVNVRMFNSFLNHIGANNDALAMKAVFADEAVIVAVASNGDISVNDELKSINFGQNLGNVSDTSLRDFLANPVHAYLDEVWNKVSEECGECAWVGYCRGGSQHQVVSNRYSAKNGFNNKSVFCDGLRDTYATLAGYMLDNGLPEQRLIDNLYLARTGIEVAQLRDAPPGSFKRMIPIQRKAHA